MKLNKTVFVTVGTTEFEQLIQAIDDPQVYETFRKFGYTKFVFQLGKGKYQPKSHGETESTEIFDLKPSLKKEFQEADLIISHCGAGTLLECLQLQKKVCAVINDTLMNNHQTELFDVLEQQNYIQGVRSAAQFKDKIESILQGFDKGLNQYPRPDSNLVDKIICQTLF